MSAHIFRLYGPPPPSRAQIHAAIDEYESHAAHGFSVNEIARRMEVTRGTAAVIRRWSIERAAGVEVRG
jgi:hypothetical protein